jgi:beta-glucosidase
MIPLQKSDIPAFHPAKKTCIRQPLKLLIILGMMLLIFPAFPSLGAGAVLPDSVDQKARQLLSRMTLEEKVGQMLNLGLPTILTGSYWDPRDTAVFDTAKVDYFLGKCGAGSIHNMPSSNVLPGAAFWFRIVKYIQDYVMQNTRLGIPVIYGIDDIHGANYVKGSTLLPQQIAIAATWNTEMAYLSGYITSYESRAASLPWNYNPNADIAYSPLWGRIGESFGEDSHLISEMVLSYMKGSQRNNLEDTTCTAVCVKHFLGYGAGINGKDRANALIPENYLRQYYIPPFQKAIDAGALSVMISSNAVNGLPCHINKYFITGILKGELGFKGVVVSDFSDVEFLVAAHQSAADMREATKMAINAGLDMVMNPYDAKIVDIIIDLVHSGEIEMARIDDAVLRILRLKFALNLFENPYKDPSGYPLLGSEEFMKDNYRAASEAVTLLKNESVLPLPKNKKILVTGYTAHSQNCLNGAWSRTFLGQETKFNDSSKLTILDAIRRHAGEGNVTYVQGTGYLKDINSSEAEERAREADYIVVCLGEMPATEKPSDIYELDMPPVQQELVRRVAKAGKPVILILVEGRPRIIREIEPLARGIVMAYLPGDEGGRAVADVLYGDVNPSGKLPYTYPRNTGNTLTYWHKKTDIRDVNWEYNGFNPQFEFGYGLSYTDFTFDNLILTADTITGDQQLAFSVDVTNTGKQSGKEVIEVYLKDVVATLSPDVKKLVRFTKTELKPGETKTISFTLSKGDLSYIGFDAKPVLEEGDFELWVGGDPGNLLKKTFNYQLNKP